MNDEPFDRSYWGPGGINLSRWGTGKSPAAPGTRTLVQQRMVQPINAGRSAVGVKRAGWPRMVSKNRKD